MKKFHAGVLAAVAVVCVSSILRAAPFDEFKDRASSELLKPFARDLGGLLGGADFHSGRSVGFPGFDVGGVGVIQSKPGSDNKIFNDAGVKAFGLPLVQAAIGLPFNVDLAVRGVSAAGISIVGGGLRYGIYKSGLAKFIPDVSVSAFMDKLDHDYFKATHYSMDVSASFDIPVIKPFVGIGFDNTKVEVKQAANPLLAGVSATSKDMRYTAGINFSPIPLIYVFGAYSIFHGVPGMQFGMGARF